MFAIHGNDIYITRGDQAAFSIRPQEDNGDTYVMEVNDHLRLRVYSLRSRRDVLTADTLPGEITFSLTAADTQRLGGRYGYDVKLYFADGSYTTIIGAAPNYIPHFTVLEG